MPFTAETSIFPSKSSALSFRMASFTNDTMVNNFSNEEEKKILKDDIGAMQAAKELDWLTFNDPAESLIDDVKTIRNNPMVPGNIPIYGFLFNVKSGKLEEIEEANKAGRVL